MRTIEIDKLIEDLKYDVMHDAEMLNDETYPCDRNLVQFDKDCKQNFIYMLEDEWRKQNEV